MQGGCYARYALGKAACAYHLHRAFQLCGKLCDKPVHKACKAEQDAVAYACGRVPARCGLKILAVEIDAWKLCRSPGKGIQGSHGPGEDEPPEVGIVLHAVEGDGSAEVHNHKGRRFGVEHTGGIGRNQPVRSHLFRPVVAVFQGHGQIPWRKEYGTPHKAGNGCPEKGIHGWHHGTDNAG